MIRDITFSSLHQAASALVNVWRKNNFCDNLSRPEKSQFLAAREHLMFQGLHEWAHLDTAQESVRARKSAEAVSLLRKALPADLGHNIGARDGVIPLNFNLEIIRTNGGISLTWISERKDHLIIIFESVCSDRIEVRLESWLNIDDERWSRPNYMVDLYNELVELIES
jgi:hypothetical protein